MNAPSSHGTIICMKSANPHDVINGTAQALSYKQAYTKCKSEQRELQSERLDIKSAIDLVTNRVMSPELQAQRALEQAQLLQHPKLLPLDVLDIETATAMKVVFKRSLEGGGAAAAAAGPGRRSTPRC